MLPDMGNHSHPNGHRGEDGSAAAAITTAFEPIRLGPLAPWPLPSDGSNHRRWRDSWRRVIVAHRAWLAAVPVILVNAVAFGAQLGFWRAHVPAVAEAVLVALALESIAIYLAWQAHLAQLADDSALRLRLAAYGMALVIGALNYSHFMRPGWRPTVAAVTFGMMSAISPWLWSVHSRRVSRDALLALKRIEPHAVRLGGTRWVWHPLRCIRVMSRATWAGESDPAKAIALPPVKAPGSAPPASPETPPQNPAEPAVKAAPPTPKTPPKTSPKRAPGRPAGPSRKAAKAAAIIRQDGSLSNEEVAKRANVSETTVRRVRAAAAPKGQDPS
jgi:hypothetical protein